MVDLVRDAVVESESGGRRFSWGCSEGRVLKAHNRRHEMKSTQMEGGQVAVGIKQAGTRKDLPIASEDQMPATGFPAASMVFGLHLICRGNGRDLGVDWWLERQRTAARFPHPRKAFPASRSLDTE